MTEHAVGPPAREAALRREADAARAAVAETVGALAAKTDVKGRVQRRGHKITVEVRESAQEMASQTRDAVCTATARVGRSMKENRATLTVTGVAGAAVVGSALAFRRTRDRK